MVSKGGNNKVLAARGEGNDPNAPVFLLVNRYVPLAVAMLAPVIVNILTFHALMAPSGLPMALFVAVLWTVIFIDVRPAFSGLFQPRLQPKAKL
jgi:putative oxidoreductase